MHLPKEMIPGGKPFTAGADVYMESGHICIKKEVAEQIFGAETVVLTVFYSKNNSLLIAPASEELFKKLHKTSQQMLKMKNAHGDKSISIQEVLLDNDIDENDRDLEFLTEGELRILKVKL